mgnify:CR=1 FL=1
MFEDFNKTNAREWKEKIIQDLKGASYEDQLIWESPEKIKVQPFYNSEDSTVKPENVFTSADWDICEEFMVEDETTSNKAILTALIGGANSIVLYLNEGVNLDLLFKDVLLDCIQVHFVLEGNPENLIKAHLELASKKGIAHAKLKGSIHYDVYENLTRTGNWFKDEATDHTMIKTLLAICPENIHCICIDTPIFQNAGANMVEQLAISIGIANEYVQKFGVEILPKIAFFTAVGSNYFFEIAKLRALRSLWKFLANSYGIADAHVWIHAENSLRNKSIYDPYVNMLRTGSEVMSAVLGGVDSFSNKSFDAAFKMPDNFGTRIARNQQSLLKGESYIDKVSDPAAGTYYIENITEELAERAFELFKETEAKGGFLACLQSGEIQASIKRSAAEEQKAFDTNVKQILGTNLYPNKEETMLDEVQFTNPFCTVNKDTTIEPILAQRLSEKSDIERLNSEKK